MPHAILWDMDGTIVDSEEYWITAEIELVELFGGIWTHQDGMELVGNGLPTTAEKLQRHGVDLSIDEIIQALTNRVLEQLEVSVPWRPGALELIQQLPKFFFLISRHLFHFTHQFLHQTFGSQVFYTKGFGIICCGSDETADLSF